MAYGYNLGEDLVDHTEAETLKDPIGDANWSLSDSLCVDSFICLKKFCLNLFFSPFQDVGFIVGHMGPPRSLICEFYYTFRLLSYAFYVNTCPSYNCAKTLLSLSGP